MEKPFFSIIIPSFNSERFIGAAIESALAQSYKNIEVIVVDEHSKDKTVQIVNSFVARDPRVRYFDQIGDKGPARARNQGLEMASGEYVTFFDSDNILLPDACEVIKKIIDEGGRKDVYFSDIRYFESEVPDQLLQFTLQRISKVTFAELMKHNFINLLGTFLHREAVQKVGGFDNRFRTCEEHILWLRLALWANASFEFVPQVLGHLRFHLTNLTWRASYFVEAAETNFVIYDWLEKEIRGRNDDDGDVLLAELQNERMKWLFRAGLGGLVLKDRKLATHYFNRWVSIAKKPAWLGSLIKFVVAILPLSIVSSLIMSFRRRFVMRRYIRVPK